MGKINCQCSNCAKRFSTIAFPGVPEAMFDEGYRAVGDALYCPACVEKWADRNGSEFDAQYRNPPHLFSMWWNKTVEAQVEDKSRLKKYRMLANGDFVEVGTDGGNDKR